MELAGEVLDGWNVSAGYTYQHTRDANDDYVYSSVLQTTTPQQVVRLFNSYRLPGALDKVTIGAGVNWQSEFFGNVFQPNPNDTVNFGQYARITQDSYYLVDLMARYRFNEHLSTTLNVKNAFDKSTTQAWATSVPVSTASRAACNWPHAGTSNPTQT